MGYAQGGAMNKSLIFTLVICLALNLYINHKQRLRSVAKGLTAMERSELNKNT